METTLVIPAYNEEARIPATLEGLAHAIGTKTLAPLQIREVLIVDDGSTDATQAAALKFQDRLPGLRILRYEKNQGKGFAVYHGISNAQFQWVLMADADMSTPWEEGAKLALAVQEQGAEIALGSRDTRGSQILTHQSFLRENLGKSFNRLVKCLTPLPFNDTQCGFKLMALSAVKPLLPFLKVFRFAWDVELLVAAHLQASKIIEVPIRWEHRDASRVHPVRDGLEMAGSVLKLRARIAFGDLRRLKSKHTAS